MKKGQEAHKAFAEEEAKAEAKAAQSQQVRRFWMPPNGEASLTFLDGDLDADGALDIPMYREHQVFMNGNWRNWFVCIADDEVCPICQSNLESDLVGVFTVIDHSEFTSKKSGKVFKDQKRLFVAKRNTLKILQKIATKRKGLAGATFDVSRSGDKVAAVGDMFDFTEKRTLKAIKALYEDAEVVNYEEEIKYLSRDELLKLGFGAEMVGQEATTDYDDQL
jgi:hypothetical protein